MLVYTSLVVFAITLVLTKSKIMGGKREFIEREYQVAKQNAERQRSQVAFVHRTWHAIWTCPMCSGFWVAIVVALFFHCPIPGWDYPANVLILFGLNWLFHCLENTLFYTGEILKKIDEETLHPE
jgi:hypothetical protein